MKKICKNLVIILTIFSQVSCTYKPILHEQNAKYKQVGKEQAEIDVDACKKEADDNIDKYRNERAGKEAVRKGTIGAIIGTVFGFLMGGNTNSTLGGAAIGTGLGAGIGAGSVYSEDRLTPSEMKQRLVTQCLQAKGYEVLGWR